MNSQPPMGGHLAIPGSGILYTNEPPMSIHLRLTLQRGDRLKSSESDVCRRQILTTKVYPRAVIVKIVLMAVDP